MAVCRLLVVGGLAVQHQLSIFPGSPFVEFDSGELVARRIAPEQGDLCGCVSARDHVDQLAKQVFGIHSVAPGGRQVVD